MALARRCDDEETAANNSDVDPNQITQWRSQLFEGAAGVIGAEANTLASDPLLRSNVTTLRAKIGETIAATQIAIENILRASHARWWHLTGRLPQREPVRYTAPSNVFCRCPAR